MAKPLTLITGANGVLGLASSKLFSSHGIPLVLGCRTLERANELLQHFPSSSSPLTLPLDLSSIKSTKEGAERVACEVVALKASEVVLIHNAGTLLKTRRITSDGMEETLQTNFISPVLLTLLVSKHLSSNVSSIRNVFVSANAYKTASINWSDLEFQQYDGWKAYLQAKRMQVTLSRLLSKEEYANKLNKLLGIDPSKVPIPSRIWLCLDPGWIKTNLVRSEHGWSDTDYSKMMGGAKNTPEEAAESIWNAASSPTSSSSSVSSTSSSSSSEITSGDFLVRGKPQKVIPGVDDPVEQEKLWKFTEEVLKTFDKA